MTRTVDDAVYNLTLHEPASMTPPDANDGGARPVDSAERAPRFLHRHRVAMIVMSVIATVLVTGGAAFIYEWNHSGPQQLSMTSALQRFRSGATGLVTDPGALHPREGVYDYTGSGSERVSLPPKSQTEGPRIPGTVSYRADGCWTQRMDYSDSHWQSATYCPRHGNLVQIGRGGWYRWDFVALVIADTATFTCSTPEMAIPKTLRTGEHFSFTCRGTNSPIRTGIVTLSGTSEYIGPQILRVAGTAVPSLHFHEEAHFSGGQVGTNVADTWFSTIDGLPVRGSWSTRISSPTPVGTSTLTGRGNYTLTSLRPRS